MGYNSSSTNLTLTAKLTPLGRQKIITNDNGLMTYFSFGDSDANYYAALPLLTGQVPTAGGNLGSASSSTNSIGSNTDIKSALIVNSSNITKSLNLTENIYESIPTYLQIVNIYTDLIKNNYIDFSK